MDDETTAGFDDLLDGNDRHVTEVGPDRAPRGTAKKLAVVTCIDPRIDPLTMLGLRTGDASVIRSAGARVTDDVLRALILSVGALGVERVAIVHHTDCAVVGTTNDAIAARLDLPEGSDATGFDFRASADPLSASAEDIGSIRGCALLPPDLPVAAFVLDLENGRLAPVAT